MSLDIGPDRPDRADLSQEQTLTRSAPPVDPGIAALQQLTNGAVSQIYGRENAGMAGARLEELGHFDREQAAEVLRDNPEALAPVQDRAVAAQLAEVLPSIYASTDIARPPVMAETLERDGVTYNIEGLQRVRDERGATHLVGASNEPSVAYLDRERGFPYTFHVRAFHPDASFGGGFDGDNRSFSTSLDVTSRIQQEVTLDTSTDGLTQRSWSDESHNPYYPLISPWLPTRATETPESGTHSHRVQNSGADVEQHSFTSYVQGNNPLVPGSPNIDVDGHFTVTEDLARGRLHIRATFKGDNFPNTESFVTDRGGHAVFIATGTLDGSPLDLIGEHQDRQVMRADLEVHLDRNGMFTGVSSGGRDYTVAQWNTRVQQNPQ